MYSILDIDLDYFNHISDAPQHLGQLLTWAACPVSMVLERHNHAFQRWKKRWRTNGIEPTHILHVDEHHDMMDQRQQTNIANFMLHAMCTWQNCRVHWLVQYPIDSPAMWLDDEMWENLRQRFTQGPRRPVLWPKPDIVSVCTSPDFVPDKLEKDLTDVLSGFTANEHKKKMRNKAPQPRVSDSNVKGETSGDQFRMPKLQRYL